MNNLLQLKGTFHQESYNVKFGSKNLPTKKAFVTVEHLIRLRMELEELIIFWNKERYLNGVLLSVCYSRVIPKSKRVKSIFSKPDDRVVGARFVGDTKKKHVITYYIEKRELIDLVNLINQSIDILQNQFNGKITYDQIEAVNKKKIVLQDTILKKTKFIGVVVDVYHIESFLLLTDNEKDNQNSIITIYDTDTDTISLLKKIGVTIYDTRIIDDTTILLRPDQVELLKERAPYLISMATNDISELTKDDFSFTSYGGTLQIPSPKKEPIIGVIDTLFDENVYFSEWVEYIEMLDPEIKSMVTNNDYNHGTAVTSIIVDGPTFNPNLDDGCGRFRVRHFGVAAGNRFSSFTILRNIKEIVSANQDIKVWNLSLGSALEVHPNFISPEAAILDQIQYENNVIFVVAGTNNNSEEKFSKAIGAPADSINSLVVNAVDFQKNPASYSRKGIVLSFFNKPDISYYGGDGKDRIRVCTPTGEGTVTGTSFAAPWIARKMAYLIEIIGLNREEAKSLIIDSTIGWEDQIGYQTHLLGYGIVPKRIENILKSEEDEIKFIVSGVSEEFNSYTYNLPVPISENKHPFVARATLSYFPCCSRKQGVDYTNTELDIQFGRINDKGKIEPLNGNLQNCEGHYYLEEKDARRIFRKWDNIKHIKEVLKKRTRAKKVYERGAGLWGISIKTKERLSKGYGKGLNFSIVITLKEINGVNRIDDFIKQCSFRGWLVNRIDINNRIEIYNRAEEEIEFD